MIEFAAEGFVLVALPNREEQLPMARIGDYETVRELNSSGFGSVSVADRVAGNGPLKAVVKVLQPSAAAVEVHNADEQIRLFLDSARVQQQAAAGSRHWAPIHQVGEMSGGAFYVTDHYEQSVQRLIGRARFNGSSLHKLIMPILQGLQDLKRICRRSHGNLKPSNVLLRTRRTGSPENVALTDACPTEALTAKDSVAADLEAVGELLYAVVIGREFDHLVPWPIQPSPEWSRLGRYAERWRALCNFLLDPSIGPHHHLEEVARRVQALAPSRPLWPAAAAVALVAGGASAAYYLHHKSAPILDRNVAIVVQPLPTTQRTAETPVRPVEAPKLVLKTIDGKQDFPAGGDLAFVVRSLDRDRFLTLLCRDSAGHVELLLPDYNLLPRPVLVKGREVRLPPAGSALRFPVKPPYGARTIKAIATVRPLPDRLTLPAGAISSDDFNALRISVADGGQAALRLDDAVKDRDGVIVDLEVQLGPGPASAGTAASGGDR